MAPPRTAGSLTLVIAKCFAHKNNNGCKMKSSLTTCVLLLSIVIGLTSTASFPKNWLRCKQSDPEFHTCLKGAVPDAIRKMKNKGIPALGVFSIDPLAVTDIELLRGNEGPVSLNLNFKNLNILGIAESSVSEYNTSLKTFEIYTRSLTPAFRLVGDYNIRGSILVLPITGKGKADIVLENLDTRHWMKGEPVTVNGKTYMKIVNYTISFKPTRMVSKLDNLFNGDKRLGETMNNFMNENWEQIFPEIRGGLQETFGALFEVMANRIFLKVPLNEIFPA